MNCSAWLNDRARPGRPEFPRGRVPPTHRMALHGIVAVARRRPVRGRIPPVFEPLGSAAAVYAGLAFVL
jgi:hypothetical protein